MKTHTTGTHYISNYKVTNNMGIISQLAQIVKPKIADFQLAFQHSISNFAIEYIVL